MPLVSFYEYGAATFGVIGVIFGLSAQIVRNYRQGESRMHWMLNGAFMLAMLFRIGMFYETGRFVVMIVDMFGVAASFVIVLQGFGYFLKPRIT